MANRAGGLIVTLVVPGAEAQPPVVAVTLYKPLAFVVAPAIEGFWLVEKNPLGPAQL